MANIDISTTAIQVAPLNISRREVHFQNTGDNNIYFKKQVPNQPVDEPSEENYDFILYPRKYNPYSESDFTTDDTESDATVQEMKKTERGMWKSKDYEYITEKTVYSVASFRAVSIDDGSVLAVMETNFV